MFRLRITISLVAPVRQSVKERFAVFRRLFQHLESKQDSPLKAKDTLRSLPRWQLECIAPAPEWLRSAELLNIELENRLGKEKPDQPIIVMVGPPHGGHTEILTAWATLKGRRLLSPPSPRQILDCDDSWLFDQRDDGGPWVFPALEKGLFAPRGGIKPDPSLYGPRLLGRLWAGHHWL